MSTFSDIKEIILCLRNTFQSLDRAVRDESEKKINEFKKQDIVTFTSQLIDALKLSSKEIDSNIRISIILLLKRSIKEKIESEPSLERDKINQLIQLYITIIVNPIITEKELENLKETFVILLNNTTGEILIEILSYINKQLSSMPLGSVGGVITILSCVIESSALNNNKKIFLAVLENILNMASSIMVNLYNKYENINPESNYEDYFKFNSLFYHIFYLFFYSNNLAYKKYKIKDEKFSEILEKINIIGIKLLVNLKAKDNNRIISWTGDKNKDKNLNNMKINIFKFINLQLKKYGDIIIDKNIIENHDQLIKIVMANLEWIIMNKFTYINKMESTNDFPNYSYSILISFMFIYLRRSLGKDNYINDYTMVLNSMYKNILLPLLLVSDIEEEIALDNDSFNGYLIDMNDILYENKQKNIKSSVSFLIKKIFEKNSNTNSFMIKYTLGLLDYLINNASNNLEDKSLYDQNDIIILLLKAYQKEKIITTLFLALNIFSAVEKCPNQEENLNYISHFFKKSFDTLTGNLNYPLLKHQFILFIRNYSLKLYEPDNSSFEVIVKFLYEYLFDINKLLISNEAAETIHAFFSEGEECDDKNISYILTKVASSISLSFENQIMEIQNSNFFEVLYQIMANFENRDNEFFIKIFINLCKRIGVEIERHYRLKFRVTKEKNKTKKKAKSKTNLNDYKIIINKCFNVLRMLINNKRFVENNFDKIEDSLKPLSEYMNDPEKIEFDEDIIYIVYMIILHRQRITGLCFSVIKYLYKYIDKIKGLLLDVYQLINVYLAYGTKEILSNKVWYEGIFEAFKSGLKADKFDKSGLYTCMLMQTWVIHCPNLPQNLLSPLINDIIERMNKIGANYKLNNNFNDNEERYSFLGYLAFLLSGLINYSELIIPPLKALNNDKILKEWINIVVRENEIIFEYEIKIIIYSICKSIINGIFNGDISYLIYSCIELLHCQEKNGKYELKKKTKKINFLFVEEEDKDDGNEDEEEEDAEYREIKEIVKCTINPVKDFDEFKNVNDLLHFLQNNKTKEYNLWEKSLDEEKKNSINKLLWTKRINIAFNKNNSVAVPRRIVSIKRNINNDGNK